MSKPTADSVSKSVMVFVAGDVSTSFVKVLHKFLSDGAYVYTHEKTRGRDNLLGRVLSELPVIEVYLEGSIGDEIYMDSDYGIAFSKQDEDSLKIVDFVRRKLLSFKKPLIVIYS